MQEQFYDYESRLNRPVKVKIPDFCAGDRLKHLIFADQLTRKMIERLGRTADRIRMIHKSDEGFRFLKNLLPRVKAMLYFTQPSTRTFLSFMSACQILGINCSEVRDTSTSSESKGESAFDSMRTFSSYFDIVIMRSPKSKFAECCAYMMNDLAETSRRNIPIINAGSGADEHPTQALLDIYTINRALAFDHPKDSSQWTYFEQMRETYPQLTRGIDGKTFGFCGDVHRGRTVRSLASLLTLYDNISMRFVSPNHDKLRISNDLRQRLLKRNVDVREFSNFEDLIDDTPVISDLDVLYMTRIQKEHNTPELSESLAKLDFSSYKLSLGLVEKMKPYAAVLHPFPRDNDFGEIPSNIDSNHRAHYFRQARNGMWVRAALLAFLFDVDGEINEFYDELTLEHQTYNEGAI